jgi:hypothetical protein
MMRIPVDGKTDARNAQFLKLKSPIRPFRIMRSGSTIKPHNYETKPGTG